MSNRKIAFAAGLAFCTAFAASPAAAQTIDATNYPFSSSTGVSRGPWCPEEGGLALSCPEEPLRAPRHRRRRPTGGDSSPVPSAARLA